jgi:hypothetical protein
MTMRRSWCIAWASFVAVTVAACSSPPPKGDQAGGDKPIVTAVSKVAEKIGEVTLTPVKWPELQAAIAAQKGKVVLLDIWGEF